MRRMLDSFVTEQEMSDNLSVFLESALQFHHFRELRQFRGPVGIPDHLLLRCAGGEIVYAISLELKLKDWHQGLIQAFRYRSYVNASFVVLADSAISSALEKIEHFRRANIGLASFSLSGEFKVCFNPQADLPFSVPLAEVFSRGVNSVLCDQGVNLKSGDVARFLRSKLGFFDLSQIEEWV